MTENVTNKDYATFIDTGVVNHKLLIDIARKVKNSIKLSPRESAILKDKISEINSLLMNMYQNKNE